MIKNYIEYKEYIKQDYIANKMNKKSSLISPTWRYILCLRKYELYFNSNSFFRKTFYKLMLQHYSVKTGITIPANTFGKGLYIPHYGCIVVNGSARFGDYCVIQCGVNISENASGGNHIYLGAGAKILRGVNIADDVIIGANAVITKDINDANTVWGGIPAKKISNKGYRNREII